jgi:hypothetical protein
MQLGAMNSAYTPINVLILSFVLLLPRGAQAQQSQPQCATADSAYRALDFWIGEWDVYMNGARVGRNSIRTVVKGCAIEEHWEDASGGVGMSLFYIEAMSGRWKQVWVTDFPRAMKEKIMVARYPDGGVRFQGEVFTPRGRVMDRTTLTPQPSGYVRQLIEVSTDGGTTWTTSFDGEYRPRQ